MPARVNFQMKRESFLYSRRNRISSDSNVSTAPPSTTGLSVQHLTIVTPFAQVLHTLKQIRKTLSGEMISSEMKNEVYISDEFGIRSKIQKLIKNVKNLKLLKTSKNLCFLHFLY